MKSTSEINREIEVAMKAIADKWPFKETNHEAMRACRIEMTAWLLKCPHVWNHRIPELVDWYLKIWPAKGT
jgi:hypothetical protein